MAWVSYRAYDDKIYIQTVINREEDKANIILSRTDWRADGVVPTRAFDDMFPIWCEQHKAWKSVGMTAQTRAEADRVGMPTETNSVVDTPTWYPDPFYDTCLIYEKATDKFIGFQRSWIDGSTSQHIVTCFDPAMRGKGFNERTNILSGKIWFLYSGGENIEFCSPKGKTSYYVEDPDIEVYKRRYDRIDPVDYIKTVLTKEQYIAMMDLPANQADRDLPFTIERYIEV